MNWPSLSSLKLRTKLIVAFVGMAVLAGICGTVGLLFVGRIGASVAVFSDVTSPLLTESMALVDNAKATRSTLFRAINDTESAAQLVQRLPALQADGQTHLRKLRDLAARAGIELHLENAEQRANDFAETLNHTLDVYRREQAAAQVARARWNEYEEKYHALQTGILSFANRAEERMSTADGEAQAQLQAGSATVEGVVGLLSRALALDFPVVQVANRLMRETEQIDESIKWLQVLTDQTRIDGVERDVADAFKRQDAASKRLAALPRREGNLKLEPIQFAIAELEGVVLGADGLFAAQRQEVSGRAEIATARETLDRIERAYVGILNDVQSAVTTLNQQARQDAASGISQSHTIIAASVLFTIIAGLAAGIFFAQRITGPLRRLAEHAATIRSSGELQPLPDAMVAGRNDEIGTLSHSFNLMIAELAEARRRLIARSEAEVRKQYERLNVAINNMPQGLCMFDSGQKLIIANRRYADIYGMPPELTAPGTPLRDILAHRVASGATPDSQQDYVETRLAAVAERKPLYIVNELRDGHVIAISHQPMLDGGSIATHEDITERRKAEAKIEYMAHHDALTGLPNRARLRTEMEKALSRVARGEMLSVLCLDLDHFKSVNDTLGHPVGDALLQAVAVRIQACLRPSDTVARLGGDEFAIVQVSASQPVGATALATRLIKEIAEPFEIGGHQVIVGTSIGIAIAPNDGSDADRLMKNADMALYRAKEDGRGTYRFFEPEMDARMQARRTLELDLRKALALGEFELFYQPLVKLESNEVSCCEALLRWRHPERGLVAPDEFIPLAEEIGLIVPIGAWVLRQACAEAMAWSADIRVAVNLSPVQFKHGTVVLDVVSALHASGLPAQRLEVEITETVLLQDTDATVSTLNRLRELGVRISMDDFGTGYSSLGYLRKFPFDKIKIDRSFVRDLCDKPDSIAIVRAVTGLGSSLGIATTAEGVETAEQLRQLRAEGCTEVQGYLISEPKPARELAALLQSYHPPAKAVA